MLGEDDTAAIGRVPGGNPPAKARRVIVLMDTTYWGRNLGLMLFKDAITNRDLLRYYVRSETVQDYIRGGRGADAQGLRNRGDRLRWQAGADAGVRGHPRSDVHVPPAGDHP